MCCGSAYAIITPSTTDHGTPQRERDNYRLFGTAISEPKVYSTAESVQNIETAMGIVSSTFASLAIQLAWNCQRLLDPQYRCLEGKRALENPPNRQEHPEALESAAGAVEKPSSSSSSTHLTFSEMRGRKRALGRQRYRKRPASFDTALIANRCDNTSGVHVTCVATSTPSGLNPRILGRPQPLFWDVTSSSGCSSDSGSYLDSDSEVQQDDRLNEAFVNKNGDTEDEKENFSMSADEEAALRMTVGRGHFSRSKKDKFLNHLRLEKRLSGLNNAICDADQRGHGRSNMVRRYSGDLYRVSY